MEWDIGEASLYFSFTVYGIVNNCVSTMITMSNEDKDRLVVMAVLSSIEEILKTMKKEALQEPANVQGLCDAVKNVLLSKVSACPCTLCKPARPLTHQDKMRSIREVFLPCSDTKLCKHKAIKKERKMANSNSVANSANNKMEVLSHQSWKKPLTFLQIKFHVYTTFFKIA